MQTAGSLSAKSAMSEQITEYILTLHSVSNGTKEMYASYLKQFAKHLISIGIKRFEDATRRDIDHYLATKQKQNTRNLYIFIIKNFYKRKWKIVKGLMYTGENSLCGKLE